MKSKVQRHPARKSLVYLLMTAILLSIATFSFGQSGEYNYKRPHIDKDGKISDVHGTIIGRISNGIIYNATGDTIGYIDGNDKLDESKKKIGYRGKNGDYYDKTGALVFTVDPKSNGEKCAVLDPEGKVVATVHESYKSQVCALHCLKLKEKQPK